MEAPKPPATPSSTLSGGRCRADPLRRTEPVLDREHEGVAAQQRSDGGGGRCDAAALVAMITRSQGPGSPYPSSHGAAPCDRRSPPRRAALGRVSHRYARATYRLPRPRFPAAASRPAYTEPIAPRRLPRSSSSCVPFVEMPAIPAKTANVSRVVGIGRSGGWSLVREVFDETTKIFATGVWVLAMPGWRGREIPVVRSVSGRWRELRLKYRP